MFEYCLVYNDTPQSPSCAEYGASVSQADANRALLRRLNYHASYSHQIVALALRAVQGGEECPACQGGYDTPTSDRTGRVIMCRSCHDSGRTPRKVRDIFVLGDIGEA